MISLMKIHHQEVKEFNRGQIIEDVDFEQLTYVDLYEDWQSSDEEYDMNDENGEWHYDEEGDLYLYEDGSGDAAWSYPVFQQENNNNIEWDDDQQTNNNNVTFIRANQIALIEERGMTTTTLQTKEKACEAEPVVKNELSQTERADHKEEESQTEVVHLNSLSHVSSLVLPTIQVQVEDGLVDFLVDTGSSVSIVKSTAKEINTQRRPILQAVNGTYVQGKGMVTLNVMLQEQPYPHEFIVADVIHNIIGYDFWAAYQMYLRPTYQGVEVFAADMTPLLQLQNRLLPPKGIYRAVVNAIFPCTEGDTLGQIDEYCQSQQWREENAPVNDNLAIVPSRHAFVSSKGNSVSN